MESWARKYRPQGYEDYIGDSLKLLVQNRFQGDDLPNVVLISGERGSGKTSMAWLLAKEYNCIEKVNGHACNKCEICEDINNHIANAETGLTVYGVEEIDIAAQGRRADIDDIIEEALLAPQYPLKYKILIMDEFHMANKNVQNRLLKVMEEPPKHLVFILCTTNPEAIIPTILSRCQVRMQVHKADAELLAKRLLYIAERESLKISREAIDLIIKKTERIPREAIMTLEEIAKSNNNQVTVQMVYNQMNGINTDKYIQFYEYANKDLEAIVGLIFELKQQDTDMEKFIEGLAKYTMECIYVKYGYNLEENNSEFLKSAKKLFKEYTNTEISRLLQILDQTLTNIRSSGHAELRLINLAQRISKKGLLREGLGNREAQAEKETKKGIHIYSDEHKLRTSDTQETTQVDEVLDEYENLKAVDSQGITIHDTSTDSEKEDIPVDEAELLKFFEE